MDPKASCGVLNPPLRGIVQLTNSATPIVTFRLFAFGIGVSTITGTGEDRKPSSVPRFGYPTRGDDHSSGTAVACCLKRHYPRTSGGPPLNVLLFGLAPDGVYHAFPVASKAVSSYLAFSPLPRSCGAVYFLWHFP